MRDGRTASFAGDDSLYEVLQVSPRAEPDVIRAAYRVLVRLYHPDVCQDPDAEERTCRLNSAHHILGDPERRAIYDASRSQSGRPAAGPAPVTDSVRSSRSAAMPRDAFHDRSRGVPLLVLGIVATMVVTVTTVLLMLLWTLYEAVDGPGQRGLATDDRVPVTVPESWRVPSGGQASPSNRSTPSGACDTPRLNGPRQPC